MVVMETLQELIDSGRAHEVTAFLDNDNVSFLDREGNELLALHPYDVQIQALAALGIESEPV